MSELLAPNRKDISEIYETEFKQMAEIDVPLEELEEARENLIQQINSKMTDNEKKFLLSFKNKRPEWNLLEMENVAAIANLPSVLWKMNKPFIRPRLRPAPPCPCRPAPFNRRSRRASRQRQH